MKRKIIYCIVLCLFFVVDMQASNWSRKYLKIPNMFKAPPNIAEYVTDQNNQERDTTNNSVSHATALVAKHAVIPEADYLGNPYAGYAVAGVEAPEKVVRDLERSVKSWTHKYQREESERIALQIEKNRLSDELIKAKKQMKIADSCISMLAKERGQAEILIGVAAVTGLAAGYFLAKRK